MNCISTRDMDKWDFCLSESDSVLFRFTRTLTRQFFSKQRLHSLWFTCPPTFP